MTRPSASWRIERFDPRSPVDELLALAHAAFADPPIVPPSSVLHETVEDFERRLREETCWAAWIDDRLAGSVFCVPHDDALYIGRLAVHPDRRRRGIASALMDASIAQARRQGFPRLTLRARIALPGNVALFGRLGFVITASQCHPGFTEPTFYDMQLRL